MSDVTSINSERVARGEFVVGRNRLDTRRLRSRLCTLERRPLLGGSTRTAIAVGLNDRRFSGCQRCFASIYTAKVGVKFDHLNQAPDSRKSAGSPDSSTIRRCSYYILHIYKEQTGMVGHGDGKPLRNTWRCTECGRGC